MPKKTTKLPDIEPVKKKAAQRLKISERSLTTWQKEPGFPNYDAGYDIPAIKKWAEARGRKNSDVDKRLQKLEEEFKKERNRKAKLEADRLSRREQEELGNILPRDEYEECRAEQISVARDRLMMIPRELCKNFPKKYHKSLIREGEKLIEKELDHLAREFEEGPTD